MDFSRKEFQSEWFSRTSIDDYESASHILEFLLGPLVDSRILALGEFYFV